HQRESARPLTWPIRQARRDDLPAGAHDLDLPAAERRAGQPAHQPGRPPQPALARLAERGDHPRVVTKRAPERPPQRARSPREALDLAHGAAPRRHVPDLPPVFSTSSTDSITIPRSIALHMS